MTAQTSFVYFLHGNRLVGFPRPQHHLLFPPPPPRQFLEVRWSVPTPLNWGPPRRPLFSELVQNLQDRTAWFFFFHHRVISPLQELERRSSSSTICCEADLCSLTWKVNKIQLEVVWDTKKFQVKKIAKDGWLLRVIQLSFLKIEQMPRITSPFWNLPRAEVVVFLFSFWFHKRRNFTFSLSILGENFNGCEQCWGCVLFSLGLLPCVRTSSSIPRVKMYHVVSKAHWGPPHLLIDS